MGTSYTRQASTNITNGNIIDAADLNNEFNAIEDAFDASTGHSHNGTDSAYIEETGPTGQYSFTSSAMLPSGNLDIGATGNKFQNAYFSGDVNTATVTTSGLADLNSVSINSSTTITSIDTDLSSVSASHDTLASALAIKTYIDEEVTAQDLDITDGTNITAIDLDSESLTFTGSTGISATVSDNTVTFSTTDSEIVHDNLSGFVANEHVNHANVSITAGTGLSGGGTIAATRSIALSHLGLENLSDPNDDRIAFWDDSAGSFQWLDIGNNLAITGGTSLSTATSLSVISSISSIGAFTIDSAGDINLDAAGSDVNMKINGSTKFNFDLGASPELNVTGDFALDSTGNMDIYGGTHIRLYATNDIYLKPTGDTVYMEGVTSGEQMRFDLNTDEQKMVSSDKMVLEATTGNVEINSVAGSSNIVLNPDADVVIDTAALSLQNSTNDEVFRFAGGASGTISTYSALTINSGDFIEINSDNLKNIDINSDNFLRLRSKATASIQADDANNIELRNGTAGSNTYQLKATFDLDGNKFVTPTSYTFEADGAITLKTLGTGDSINLVASDTGKINFGNATTPETINIDFTDDLFTGTYTGTSINSVPSNSSMAIRAGDGANGFPGSGDLYFETGKGTGEIYFLTGEDVHFYQSSFSSQNEYLSISKNVSNYVVFTAEKEGGAGIRLTGVTTGGLARTVYFNPEGPSWVPGSNDIYDLGSNSLRWDDVYATNGTINTSDSALKQDVVAISEAETRVAQALKGLLRKYRWISSVEAKGDAARYHFGIMAQDVKQAFEDEGLDPFEYAMLTKAVEWVVEETEGEPEVYSTQAEAPEGAVEKTTWGVRYTELLAFIIAGL